ncbi:MAG TPA: transporter [Bacteroidia bacterium]|jgi:hypothetical protein|nr:transporter [Bacteroidia bacterium]
MRIQLNWLLAVILLTLQSNYTLAQSSNDTAQCSYSCCGTDLTPAGVMISDVHTKNEWMVSYRYMGMYMHDLLLGTASQNKEEVFAKYLMSPDRMNMQMHMLMGMYGITDRLTIMAMFNYQFNSMDMSMYTANHVHGSTTMTSPTHTIKTTGLGDIKLHALYGVIQRNTYQFVLSLGASIPTGSIYEKGNANDPMYPNKHYPYNMQLGSGSVEILPAITYMYRKNSLAFSASVSDIYRTTFNALDYKLSNEFNCNAWVAYQWLPFISSSFRLDGTFSGTIQGRDSDQSPLLEPGTDPLSYGTEKINAYIGTSFHFKQVHKLGIEYGMPLYQYVYGIQLKQKYIISASWAYTF